MDVHTPEAVAWRNQVALGVATLQELDGWKIKRSVEQLWSGASAAEVLAGAISLDGASREAVKMILFHVHKLEKERGPRPRVGGAATSASEAGPATAAAAEGDAPAAGAGDNAHPSGGSVSEVFITSSEEDESEEEDGEEGDDAVRGARGLDDTADRGNRAHGSGADGEGRASAAAAEQPGGGGAFSAAATPGGAGGAAAATLSLHRAPAGSAAV